ncbi:MAG: calcium/sodium antiporter [Pseudomonadota bacterium]
MIIVLMLIAGLVLLAVGGEALVRGATGIGRKLGLSPIFVGMVIVGFGTSVPELAVSIEAVLWSAPGIAVGNVAGSNVANILLILGTAALIQPIATPGSRIWQDGSILVAVSLIVPLLGMQDVIPRWQGFVMLGLLAGFLWMEFAQSRQRTPAPVVSGAGAGGGERTMTGSGDPALAGNNDSVADDDEDDFPAIENGALAALVTVIGIGAVVLGAQLIVTGGAEAARAFGVSESFIGLSVVALGTSLPELAGAGAAAFRGQSALAYGNVVGSCIFNILCILAAAIAVGPLTIPAEVVRYDSLVMVGSALLMLLLLSTGKRLSRPEACLMLALYVGYIAARYAQMPGAAG